jgi:hypothetical protein
MNTAASQGQPTSYLLYIYQGLTTRVFAGAKCSELMIKIDPKANITWTAKFKAFPSILVSSPTPSYSLIAPQSAWQVTPTIAATTYSNLLTADVTFKRSSAAAIQTSDSAQAPYKIWVGPLTATGSMNFVMEDESQLLTFINNTQPVMTLAFTNGVGAAPSKSRVIYRIAILPVAATAPPAPCSKTLSARASSYDPCGAPRWCVGGTGRSETGFGTQAPAVCVGGDRGCYVGCSRREGRDGHGRGAG